MPGSSGSPIGRLAVLLVLVAGGCAGAQRDASEPATDRRTATVPAWLGREYADGTLAFRFPTLWKRSASRTWGQLVSDNRSRHPAFVSVRYLRGRLPKTRERFGQLAARNLRPPAGSGLTLLYTQAARLGDRRAFEATFVWQARATTPLGPTMRTFGVELPAGRFAFLVFAAERPALHGGVFGWVRKTIRWSDTRRRPSGAVVRRHRPRSHGRFVNEA